MLIGLVVVAVLLLAGGFYLTSLLSWCAGYDAAVSGSARGSLLWRHLTSSSDSTKPSLPMLESHKDIRRAVDAVSSSMWAGRRDAKPEVAVRRKALTAPAVSRGSKVRN
jgi:hypothetical protein